MASTEEIRLAETTVLGNMIRWPDTIDDIANIPLSAEDPPTDAYQQIFAAIITIHGRGHPVDVVTVAEELFAKKRSRLSAVTRNWLSCGRLLHRQVA